MAHVRKQIRDAVVARLIDQVAGVGSNVFATRVHPVDSRNVPAILIYTTDERSEKYRDDPEQKLYRRVVSLVIDILAHEDAADDRLDEIAASVEQQFESDDTFGGLLSECNLVASTDVYSGEGERMAGHKRLSFEAVYTTAAGAPETAL